MSTPTKDICIVCNGPTILPTGNEQLAVFICEGCAGEVHGKCSGLWATPANQEAHYYCATCLADGAYTGTNPITPTPGVRGRDPVLGSASAKRYYLGDNPEYEYEAFDVRGPIVQLKCVKAPGGRAKVWIGEPKAVHWEELTEVGAALSPRTRRPTDRFYQREAPRPKVRRLERADTEPLEEVRGLAARADEGRASPHEGDDLEGDDLAPPPEGEDLPPADEGEDSAAEEFDRKSAPRFSPAAAARLQEALEVAQAESSLAAPPGRWFEPGQEARKILLGTRVRGIEYEGAHLNVDALSRARVLVLEEEAAISSTVDDPLRLNDARLQPGILCEKYDWTKIDDESDVAIVVECTGAVDFFLLALSVSGSVSSATRCKGASLQTADFRAAKLIAKLNHFSVEDLLEKFREHAPRQERSRHRVSDGSMYCFGMRCDARDGNTFSSYSAKEDLKADQAALVAIAYQNKMLGDIEALLLPPVGDARKRHLALADENLKQYGKRAMMIEDNPGGLDGSASPAHAFTRGYGVQLHQEMSSSLPETISWPGGQDAARELADGALCFAILDAGVLLDVGESAKGSGRVCIIPGDTWHATLRCLDDSGRYHKVVGTSLLSKNNLLPAEDD
mmetsp:Transcript_34235/g.116122  ORF Transcript_34235/g.116122 Transcript_34235/m.116122 type:complete len:621 (+) Transcript_34235:1065-2927(+)